MTDQRRFVAFALAVCAALAGLNPASALPSPAALRPLTPNRRAAPPPPAPRAEPEAKQTDARPSEAPKAQTPLCSMRDAFFSNFRANWQGLAMPSANAYRAVNDSLAALVDARCGAIDAGRQPIAAFLADGAALCRLNCHSPGAALAAAECENLCELTRLSWSSALWGR